MNARPRAWGRVIAGGIIGAAAAHAVFAEEPATAKADDAIAAAKRDFAEIKGATSGASVQQQPSLALPKAEVPAIDLKATEPGEPLELRMRTGKLTREEKERLHKAGRSPNWLLDAMAEQKGANADTVKPGAAEQPSDLDLARSEGDFLANSAALLAEKNARASQQRNEDETARELRPAEVANPLSRYMASWMSPQDFALLKAAAGGSPEQSAAPSPSAASVSSPTIAPETDGDAPANAAGYSEPPTMPSLAGNPYLAELPALPPPANLTASSPAAAAFETPSTLLPNTPMLAPAPEPSHQAPVSSPLDDLIKSRDDEKYFKQLKRF